MKRLLWAGLFSLLPSFAQAFCGFYVGGAGAKMFNNATQVVLMRDGTTTVLSMQNNYQGPPEGFAMVIPVPIVLQKENVKTLPMDVFDRVDQLDAPRLVEYWEQDPCGYRDELDDLKAAPKSASKAKKSTGSGEEEDLGVTVEAQFTVGEYEIVILSAKESTGLETWLTDNKYNIPKGAAPVLKPYVEGGQKFFVAKVDTSKVTFKGDQAMLSPLRFHYDSETFALPVRLGLLNSSGTQDLIVHILAKDRYQASNYKNVTIPTNIEVFEGTEKEFGPFYASLFDKTLEKNPGAVVTEYSWQSTSCDPCPVPPMSAADLTLLGADVLPSLAGSGGGKSKGKGRRFFSSAVLTRIHARYKKEALGEDLVFEVAKPIVGGREFYTDDKETKLEQGALESTVNNFQARYIIRHPWKGAITCKDPQRGIWGGPPSGGKPAPMAARDLAFVARGKSLPSYLRQDIPEIGVKKKKFTKKKPKTERTVEPKDKEASLSPSEAKSIGIPGPRSRDLSLPLAGSSLILLGSFFLSRKKSR